MEAPPEKSPARRRVSVSVLVWLLVAPGVLWFLGRAFGLERGLLIMLFAGTPYVAAWTVIPLLVAALARRWTAVAVAAVVAAGMAAVVLPRAVADADTGPSTGVELRVLTVNMLYGAADPDQIVQLVRDNDVAVLAVQEFTPQGAAALKASGIDQLLPHQELSPKPEADGSGVYSRHPMLTQSSRRNVGGFQQAFATIQPPGAVPVHVESVHPQAPAGADKFPQWRTDIENQTPAGTAGPLPILLGDFNATLDHRVMRDLLDTGYRDAAAAVGEGLSTTWPSRNGSDGLVTIDHVLADDRIGVREVQVWDVNGSDHRAVFAALTVPTA